MMTIVMVACLLYCVSLFDERTRPRNATGSCRRMTCGIADCGVAQSRLGVTSDRVKRGLRSASQEQGLARTVSSQATFSAVSGNRQTLNCFCPRQLCHIPSLFPLRSVDNVLFCALQP